MQVPLITSIPRRMIRRRPNGTEIGAEYQRQCIASWREAGFSDIVTVNSKAEIEAGPEVASMAREFGVRIVPLERDASAITGRPHIFLDDLLKVGREASEGGAFAIINADIFAQDEDLAERVASATVPGRFMLARRVGVTEPELRSGGRYFWGFDLFSVHSRDVQGFPDLKLILGAPWWDYYFPIMLMLLRDAKPFELLEPAILHLEHEDRWAQKLWQELGYQLLNDVLAMIAREPLASNPRAVAHAQTLQRAVQRKTENPAADFVYHARKLLPKYAQIEPTKILVRVSYKNVCFLDQHKDVLPQSKQSQAV